ncbi:PKD domain-containing protein [Natrarchaeobius halalkaliphilus]|uniref:PKD domain-containing protein n=1 Tax=Natrarchaeobius halalkaliphilus TaxID=1679091 RepID=A0A3N6MXE0_9EURY|nr:PKD domain-containing protein [Natrarchaeobius halalkaliphilus]RQG90172.1 PKD domain-containing protein [Natrarchaeobius halalkaliphilus]
MTDRVTRRTALLLAGTAGVTALAGCGGPGEEGEADDEPSADDLGEAEPEEDTDESETEEDTDESEENGEPDEETGNGEWADVGEFYFEGRIEAWSGLEPEMIADEDNPTITLIEGQEYDFRWVNADDVVHNLEIRDENDEVVDDYVSDDVGEEGEETTLEGVVASEEMAVYICSYHEAAQAGDIEVETE